MVGLLACCWGDPIRLAANSPVRQCVSLWSHFARWRMDMYAYRLFGCRHVRPDLDVPGERKDLAATTPVHGRGINGYFCRLLFSKEWGGHRPAGCQVVVGAEAEGRKAEPSLIELGEGRQSWCRVENATLSSLNACHHCLPLFSAELQVFRASFPCY